MLHVIGDSHAGCSFRDIPNVAVHYVGAVTLKRVGVLEDDLITNVVRSSNLTPNDTLLFVFGEIDMRCYVKLYLDHHTITLETLLQEWVKNYIHHISLMPTNGAKIGIMSVVPPATLSSAQSIEWPVTGTDEERVLYTQKINEMLKVACQNKNWLYLDVYSKYAGEKGMLPLENIFVSVHINDTTQVRKLLTENNLL